MLQVSVSRPASQMTGRLPEIAHPLSRVGNASQMDVRGVSRGGSRERPPATAGSQRPLANETDYRVTKRINLHSSGGRQSVVSEKWSPPANTAHEVIPEGVEVTQGDPAKTRMPIFGNRPIGVSRDGSRLSNNSTHFRTETDELEMLLREKMKTCFSEYKKQFRDNDPEQRGNVSREVLQRILQTTLGRELTSSQMKRLMHRLGLKDKNVIGFTEFYTATRERAPGATPSWLDTVNRNGKTMTAAQVQGQLKIKACERDREMFNLMGEGVRVMKPEFRGILNRMGFVMDDDEFDKLWAKFDHNGVGNANSETLMRILGVRPSTRDGENHHVNGAGNKEDSPYAHLPKMEAQRQKSLDVERWLKNKFRQGVFTMKEAFCKYDQQNTGQVTHDNFIEVLSEFGLKIEKADLSAFLARCGVKPTKTHVDYLEFLFRFQDRGETGMPHAILTNAKHRYNAAESISGGSTFSAMEVKLMNLFQKDFLSLLGMFHKLDRLGRDVVTQEEFRAVIESRFGLDMTDDQFHAMLERIPLDTDGMVKYADFMAQLDTRGKAPSLFNGIGRIDLPLTTRRPPSRRLEDVCEENDEQGFDRLVVTTPPPDEYMVEIVNRRQPQELFKVIKDVMTKDFQLVEKEFMELDEKNSNRMSQETMYNLLKRLKLTPEVTRGEIRDLWKTFITQMDKSLDFHEFVRHFGYSLKSAAFPNAKVSPPKKGDSDMRKRSRKLNCAADMLQDNLRSKIEYLCNDVQREMLENMDPDHTGCLDPDEFREVLQELCVHLDDYELEMLCKKFRTPDDRVSYKEFLKPFISRKELWRYGNNMHEVLRHSQQRVSLADINAPVQKGYREIVMKLHQQLTSDWKAMRRAFKKLDIQGEGYVSLPEFRSVLKGAGVDLNEEDVYCIMSELDDTMTGKIAYSKFLTHVFLPKPSSRHGVVRRSAVF